jgi:replicative superfamily II helicase
MKTWNIYYDSLKRGGCILVYAKDKSDAELNAKVAITKELESLLLPAENIEILAITFNH